MNFSEQVLFFILLFFFLKVDEILNYFFNERNFCEAKNANNWKDYFRIFLSV